MVLLGILYPKLIASSNQYITYNKETTEIYLGFESNHISHILLDIINMLSLYDVIFFHALTTTFCYDRLSLHHEKN